MLHSSKETTQALKIHLLMKSLPIVMATSIQGIGLEQISLKVLIS